MIKLFSNTFRGKECKGDTANRGEHPRARDSEIFEDRICKGIKLY